MSVHSISYDVTFGDCDPAGIVFYPNIYAWLDRCFHDWLNRAGGHAALCASLGGMGIGLREASAAFRRPMMPGDRVEIALASVEWRDRTLVLRYEGRVGDTRSFTGEEQRALFVKTDEGMRAGSLDGLRDALADIGG
jgi:4-hydroxybenzoyl-CoA thioesterase